MDEPVELDRDGIAERGTGGQTPGRDRGWGYARLPVAAGAGLTTLLLGGAVTMEVALLAGLGGPGVGILGVAGGAFGALVVAVVALAVGGRVTGRWRAALAGYAAFGPGVLAVASLSYLNLWTGGSTDVAVGAGVLAAVGTATLVLWRS
jgi:hypothetical protein